MAKNSFSINSLAVWRNFIAPRKCEYMSVYPFLTACMYFILPGACSYLQSTWIQNVIKRSGIIPRHVHEYVRTFQVVIMPTWNFSGMFVQKQVCTVCSATNIFGESFNRILLSIKAFENIIRDCH